jgi:hypothetical protein
MDALKIQMSRHVGTDTTQVIDGQGVKDLRYFIWTNDHQPVRLFHIAGKFGKKLVGADADSAGQTKNLPDPCLQQECNGLRNAKYFNGFF